MRASAAVVRKGSHPKESVNAHHPNLTMLPIDGDSLNLNHILEYTYSNTLYIMYQTNNQIYLKATYLPNKYLNIFALRK